MVNVEPQETPRLWCEQGLGSECLAPLLHQQQARYSVAPCLSSSKVGKALQGVGDLSASTAKGLCRSNRDPCK